MMFFAHLKYSHVCQLSFVCVVTSLVELLHSAFSSNFCTCIFCLGKNLTLPVRLSRSYHDYLDNLYLGKTNVHTTMYLTTAHSI